jgi:hypothetical protein
MKNSSRKASGERDTMDVEDAITKAQKTRVKING